MQCFERLKLQAILRLRETYVTVSIREVAEAIRQESGPAPVDNAAVLQAELLVLSLVSRSYFSIALD